MAKAVAKAVAKAKAGPPQPNMPSWSVVWGACAKFNVLWTGEQVVRLKDFLRECGPRMRHKLHHSSKVVRDMKNPPLRWIENRDWGYARTRAEGRMYQGGGPPPYVVRKTSMHAYYNHVLAAGL